MKNSRQKGARGEREFAKFLTSKGHPASRGCQFQGGPDSPDVVCESLPFHIEVKRVQNLNIEKALQQSINDSKGSNKIPIVAHRKNGEAWKITLTAEDLFKLI